MPLDAARMSLVRQNLSAIMQNAGQTATWRVYQSASAGLAEFGLGSASYYVQRSITAVFSPVKPYEVWQGGGQIMAGDVWVTTFERVSQRDEFQWEAGGRYQVISDPVSVPLFGTAANMSLLRRA